MRPLSFFILILLFTGAGPAAWARMTSDSTIIRKNIFKLSPLSLVVGDVSLFYERVLTRRSSLVGGVGFGSESFYYSKTPSPGWFDYRRLTLEYRHYLGPKRWAPIGVYWGLYTRYAQLTLDDYLSDGQNGLMKDANGDFLKASRQINVWVPGGMVGVQAAIKRLTIDVFLGLQYQLPSSGTPLRSVTPQLMSQQQLVPRLGLSAGFRF